MSNEVAKIEESPERLDDLGRYEALDCREIYLHANV
jgi:hypothetical protein